MGAGDVDGSRRAEIVTGAAPCGGPHVRTFALGPSGVMPEAGPGGGPHVRAFTPQGVETDVGFFAY